MQTDAPCPDQNPRSQGAHTEAPLLPENVVGAQDWHAEDPAAAKFPARHVEHTLALTACSAALAVPPGHWLQAPTLSNPANSPPLQGWHVKVVPSGSNRL